MASITNRFLGVTIGYVLSLLTYLLPVVLRRNRLYFPVSRKDMRLFWKAGVGLALGGFLAYYALSYVGVSTVTSLPGTEPLVILGVSSLYLKKLERISPSLVLSTLFIVVGVMLAVP